MRSLLSLAATALAGVAAVVSSQDFHGDFVPFFVGLAVLGAVNAWAVDDGHGEARRWAAIITALLWALSAAWFAVLLVFPFQASGPPPVPDQAFAGLPATLYRMIGLYGGAILVMVATYVPERWMHRRSQSAAG
ncbi:MAG TPA: hypothetical protein VFY43_01295 [Candidatus Limnocylindria bacterium]|nr:hypothetical protein [Candidatus Limnocylindria bacterium]